MGWNCEIQTLFHGYRFLVYKDYLTFYTVDKEKAHILAVPGSVFGKAGQGHFRIACTVSDEKLREAMERLKDLSACF